ncbi:carboxymuconolactone decarboxylase family protein [Paraburkholderia sp. RL17-368-BIF-A]|uniref:carboxymuconolactone decarboxylase family protein n=1 Tax=Paraburkholderia sp. RL17-368-BIF-A TaxID=3031628 RepID=UPI0006B3F321|nr:carboxymuconolactone decarboxylase [Burkholderia sp. HB1]
MARIPLFSPDSMTPEQERVYRAVVDGPRGTVVGPLRAALHRPELADRWQRFGEILRFGTSLPAWATELAIVVTARRWNSQLEWHVHAQAAASAGISEAALESIRCGGDVRFDDQQQADIYEFARQLQQGGNVEEGVYQRVMNRWGTVGVVELGAVIGYYTLVSMTLNLHDIPLPEGVRAPLDVLGAQHGADAAQAPGEPSLPVLKPAQVTQTQL